MAQLQRNGMIKWEKTKCEGRGFPRVLMSEGREGSWGVKYLTDKGGAMALEMLYLCKIRDVLEEQVCVRGGIDVTACAYLRVYVSVSVVLYVCC